MADPLTIAASAVTAFGAVQLAPLIKLPWQRRKMKVDGDKVVAETRNIEAHTLAVLLEPYEVAAAQARRNVESARQEAEDAHVEAGDAMADAHRANQRADRIELRQAQLEQFLEGPMHSYVLKARRQVIDLGGHIEAPPRFVFVPQEKR